MYFDYPLEQGLRHARNRQRWPLPNVFWLSIRTRIKTVLRVSTTSPSEYFDYPLEQGLRLCREKIVIHTEVYFDYPLEQGLTSMVTSWISIVGTTFFSS